MISIDNIELSIGEEDTILMALYGYQLEIMCADCLLKKEKYKMLKRVNKLINKITKDYPNYDE